MKTDLKPSEFWELTLKELYYYIEGYNERLREQQEMIITNAWLTAGWGKAKKIPSLSSVLSKPVEQSESQQMAMARQITKKAMERLKNGNST